MKVDSSAKAEKLVSDNILDQSTHHFVIQSERTIRRNFGWVVFYTTKEYIETGSPSALVPGTAPVIVTFDGEVVPLSSSVPPAVAIATFDDQWRKAHVSR